METVVLGSSFVAKYPEGGGNFSVPLQYMLGLRRLKRRRLWLEVMESTGDPALDDRKAAVFRRRLRAFGFEDEFCLVIFPKGSAGIDPAQARFLGRSRKSMMELARSGTVLLNLSSSIRMPLLGHFGRKKLCSLDPTEIAFWMGRMELGQSHHDEFWTIGLNVNRRDSKVPKTGMKWRTYFPLVDTTLIKSEPRPSLDCFTTIGQWYWDGMVEFDGEWKDFSKKAAFEKFLPLARRCPEVRFELAMNLAPNDGEHKRLEAQGWHHVIPHSVARTPARYYDYLRRSTAEFSAVKLESHMNSGWLSDRSAVYLAMGRPVITEPTGAHHYLPESSGMFFVSNVGEAEDATRRVCKDWKKLSRDARACAVECFDARATMLRLIS